MSVSQSLRSIDVYIGIWETLRVYLLSFGVVALAMTLFPDASLWPTPKVWPDESLIDATYMLVYTL